jgi:transcriptional regulator GlxA family with amidase domain
LTPHELILQSAMDEAERCLADRALTPAVLAERVHVSRRTLEKLFAERGITVARWLQERRLERSRDELLSTSAEDATIEVIAERCGFADRTHFSRVFHARFGVAPGQLRRGTSAAKR